ncbi:hypothetical protein NFI96_007428 [Prochilodus magdalenae]|nr:hypothetical protein NFI96_007428 [Prochilodus magdalenae]
MGGRPREIAAMPVLGRAFSGLLEETPPQARSGEPWLVELASSAQAEGRVCSFALLPSSSSSSSPGVQRHSAAPSNIITITHTRHKSPAAARRSRTPYPHTLLEVKEATALCLDDQQKMLQRDSDEEEAPAVGAIPNYLARFSSVPGASPTSETQFEELVFREMMLM